MNSMETVIDRIIGSYQTYMDEPISPLIPNEETLKVLITSSL